MGNITFSNSNPIFIIDADNKKIFETNDAAISGCNGNNPVGGAFERIVYVEKNLANFFPAYFNNLWFDLRQESIVWKGKPCKKMILKRRKAVPGNDILHTLKGMIGILLHRFRSPLTGMRGYIELMQELNQEISKDQFSKIHHGIDHLLDILDELEFLEKTPLNHAKYQTYSVEPTVIIDNLLSEYPPEIQKRIAVNLGNTSSLNCSPGDLKKILSILIGNAIEHSSSKKEKILVDSPSPYSLRISQDGPPIPKPISENIFFPFVTSKATSLGIGLTIALLYARRHRGSIFLSGNTLIEGISFTVCLPPSQPVMSVN